MDHVAIMKKSWGLTEKIISGEKKIESRWYKSKRSPWGKINKGDTVYFKDSGEPVSIKAKVEKVIAISDLTPITVRQILNKYGKADGIGKDKIAEFYKLFRDKKYCLLVFLKNPQKIKPFGINKAGFGNMSAWLTLSNIAKIKVR
ncbi:MAG: ASCH domain-containing protein [bacterium]|nr:ASCH domain-containing protein [bacterium]